MAKLEPLFIVDTQEKKPWQLKGRRSVSKSLKVGDYTLQGYSRLVVVERKSLTDFSNRVNKMKEFIRTQISKLAKIRYSCIIVEGEPSLGTHLKYGNPESIVDGANTCILHGVPVLFCGTRETAEYACIDFLLRAKSFVDSA